MSVAEFFDSMDYGPAPEGTGPVDAWLDERGRNFDHFIGGEWVAPTSGERFESVNPATGKTLARIAQGTRADVDAAVAAARSAQPGWAKLSGHGRARVLYALARLVQKHSRALAVLETLDNGKPIRESRDIDVPLVARHFYHHAGWAQLHDDSFADHQPLGVVGQIIPWNFPLLMLAWKIAPALAAGNCVVLKPAEFTSLSSLMFADLCKLAGVPDGVVNIVTGDGATGELIVGHPGIDKIAFTGSTDVGRAIRTATAGTGKKLTLELGGKSPFIVFEDADLDSVVEGVVDAIWFNQGQVCCAGSRLLVQESVAETLEAKLKARMAKLTVGDPLDKGVDIGAIVAPVQLERITELVDECRRAGGAVWQPALNFPAGGLFYPPTLISGAAPADKVMQEEIFGPVLAMMSFRTHGEAVALANNTRYGLAASVWSESINLALDVAPKLKAGVVWINSTNLFDAACGFGGYRESGFGREGGMEGMYAYLKPNWEAKLPLYEATKERSDVDQHAKMSPEVSLDRTAKLYIGGKQARSDSGYSRPVLAPDGALIAEVGEGNRKDIRNAVEAAHKASGWATMAAHGRAQIIYYIAENLEARAGEFAGRIAAMTGATKPAARREVAASVERLFTYAAWCDKYDGAVHAPPLRDVTLAMNEPLGVIAITCPDEAPLLGMISLLAPAIAMGNRIVAVPSQTHPLAATDFYQVLETSDLPAGVVNIVTGDATELTQTLAAHDGVDGIWYFGTDPGGATSAKVEAGSVGNLKQTWVNDGLRRDWTKQGQGVGRDFLRRATQVKNIWVPYGE